MTARTYTGFGVPFIEVTTWGGKIHHNGEPFPEGHPANDGSMAVDLMPLLTQEAEDKVKRLNELGFSLVSDANKRGSMFFFINDEELETTFAEAELPYLYDAPQNLRNLEEWLAGIDPDALAGFREVAVANGAEG